MIGAQIASLLSSGVMTVGLALFAFQLASGASATADTGNALTLRVLAFPLFSQPEIRIFLRRRTRDSCLSGS